MPGAVGVAFSGPGWTWESNRARGPRAEPSPSPNQGKEPREHRGTVPASTRRLLAPKDASSCVPTPGTLKSCFSLPLTYSLQAHAYVHTHTHTHTRICFPRTGSWSLPRTEGGPCRRTSVSRQ